MRVAGRIAVVVVAMVALLVPQLASAQSLEDERDQAESSLSQTRTQLDLTTAELSEIRDEITRVQADLDDAEARLGVVEDETERLEGEAATIIQEILDLNEVVTAAEDRITDQARTLYMHGTTAAPMLAMFEGVTSEDALQRAALAGRLADNDRVVAESAEATKANFAQLQDELAAKQAVIAEVEAEAEAIREEVAASLAEAQALRDELASRQASLSDESASLQAEIARIDQAIEAREAARRERERREREAREAAAAAAAAAAQRAEEAEAAAAAQAAAAASPASTSTSSSTTSQSTPTSQPEPSAPPPPEPEPEPEPPPPPPPSSSGKVCPMSPANIVSYWGDPRGGGSRRHMGNDIAGGYRQTVYAITSGTWDIRSYGSSAGHWAILRGDDGVHYYYMHLDGYAVGDGARVSTGQHVAYNGWTGNAVGTVYHIHFEVHPGGGGAVDPYPTLGPLC